MNIYDLLKDIFQNKKGDLIAEHSFNDAFTSPFLVQRWISMQSPTNAVLINESTNKLWKGLADDKNLWYKLYITLINKEKFGKISYIKKEKKIINETQNKIIEKLSERNQLSQKETESNLELLQLFGKDVKKFKKMIKGDKSE
jgi:hypothetical protein